MSVQKCNISYNLTSSNPNLFLQGNFISKFSRTFGVFVMKTQGKLAVINRFCYFIIISKHFMIQVKCLWLVVSQTGALLSAMPQPANRWLPSVNKRSSPGSDKRNVGLLRLTSQVLLSESGEIMSKYTVRRTVHKRMLL